MILDGCFMLKILYLIGTDYTSYSNYYPILNQYGRVNFMIKADMLMLENLLPILILISLKCFLEQKDEPNVEELKDLTKRTLFLISNFYSFIENFDGIIKDLETTACLHVLDLCRKSLLPTHSEHGNASPQFSNQGKGRSNRVSHNVAHLVSTFHDAGIGFMRSKSKSLRNITFDCGILKIPNFIVSDYTETMVLNLLAFESCHLFVGHEITSFVVFMGCIIDDARDIKLLSSKVIIDNFIGPDKEVADLFNTMSKDLVMGEGPLQGVHRSHRLLQQALA
ncbi:UPF0481 protein At3g47200-like [Diospyros lotus]|uniref:UPF0481 protein At3g47200-like n=1 Tax=Diospyros lotus TaxID=55363 RepID=UPI00225A4192|nr:UPF0481 protein At3g47200-like [Diospyros lotus]